MHLFILLLGSISCLSSVEIAYTNQVDVRGSGNHLVVANERDNHEMLVNADRIIAVIPADPEDNNSFTELVLDGNGNVVRFQQRTNPSERILAAIQTLGVRFVSTVSDRDARHRRTYLLNTTRIDLIQRSRTEAERSDTIIHYRTGAAGDSQIAINQSREAYLELRNRITGSGF